MHVLICIDMYWYVLVCIVYVLVCIVCIDVYWYVLVCIVCIDVYWYVLVCIGLQPSASFSSFVIICVMKVMEMM
jgi:hypothetical protein